MIREELAPIRAVMGIPRESGDDPSVRQYYNPTLTYSPRERG